MEPTASPMIRSVHALSTGAGAQHPEHRYGSTKPTLWWVLTSREWVDVPIHCYLLEHRDGLVLFDTGLDPAIATDPDYISSRLGRFLLERIFRLNIGPDDTLGRSIRSAGFEARDVRTAVISHLHFDHIGGIGEIPQAELLVSADEWRQLDAPHPERGWILREHIELPGARWRPITMTRFDDPVVELFGGAHDVMGDGSMLLLPTPGHTAGSLSMLVRTEGLPPLLLVGDLAYDTASLMNDQVPGVGDATALRASFAKVRALKERLGDLVILPAHDSSVVEKLARATAPESGAATASWKERSTQGGD